MKKIILILALSVNLLLHSQSWVNQYFNTPNASQSTAEILSMPDGDIVSVSNETSGTVMTVIVMRLSPDGTTLRWTRRFSENRNMVSNGAIVDNQGDILFYGAIGNTNTSAFYMKIDGTNGTVLFQNTLKNPDDNQDLVPSNSQFIRAIQLEDNHYVIVGTGRSTYTNITSKINQTNGNVVWTFRSEYDEFRTSYAICQLDNGNLILTGGQADNGNTLSDNVLVCLDQANGSLINRRIWDIQYNFNNNATNLTCVNSNIDNIINIPNTNEVIFLYHIIGNNGGYIEASRDYGLARYNYVNNTFTWDVRYERNGGERGSDILFNLQTNEVIVSAFDYLNNNSRLFHRINATNGNTIQLLNVNQLGNNNVIAQLKISNIVNSNNILLSSANNIANNSLLNLGVLDFNNWLTCLNEENFIENTVIRTDFDTTINNRITLDQLNFNPISSIRNTGIDLFCSSPPCLVSNNYTIINTSIVENSIVYDGKFYINGTITFSGDIVVDITNCDFVFNGCNSGLRFINGARLRANNSVFRPCNENDFWRGVEINGSLNNKIHECTFKNAVEALQVIGFQTDAVITNNLFQNNFRGILFSNTQSTGSVSGNTFDVNNANSAIPMACLNVNMQDFSFNGIRVLNSNLLGDISQNRFVGQFSNPIERMRGIIFESSNGNITFNSFTNNQIAIQVSGSFNNNPININNNNIEYNRTNANNLQQILILGTHCPLNIKQNSISEQTNNFQSVGIEFQDGSNCIISENKIQNFNIGMFIINSNSSIIRENEIKNSKDIGIIVRSSFSIYVGCNIVNLNYKLNTGGIGISMIDADATAFVLNNPSRIISNCIFDSRVGLYCAKSSSGSLGQLVNIRNNFIYNYHDRGMDFVNYTGNVGNSTVPGKNTLYSNFSTSNDVVAVGGTITMINNYITAPRFLGSVSVSGQLLRHHSNASCANQINTWAKTDVPDHLMNCEINGLLAPNPLFGDFIMPSGGVDGALKSGLAKNLILYNPSIYSSIIKNSLYVSLSKNEQNWLKYYYEYAIKDYNKAIETLKTIEVSENKDLILVKLNQELISGLLKDDNSIFSMQTQLDTNFNQLSTRVLNLSSKNAFDYFTKYEPIVEMPANENLKYFNSSDEMKIYPNPTNGIFNIDYFNSNSEQTTVTIVDVNGKEVYNSTSDIVNISLSINLSDLSKGIYFITIQNPTEMKKGKLILN